MIKQTDDVPEKKKKKNHWVLDYLEVGNGSLCPDTTTTM